MKLEEEIKQEKFESVYQKAVINVVFTSNWLQHQLNLVLKPFFITSQQYNVLRILKGKHPSCCNVGYIKQVMLDKTPDVTRLIDRLEQKGLAHRSTNSKNRRLMDVRITDEGVALLNQIKPMMNSLFNDYRNNLTETEAETLSSLLDKLRG
jgi:DNA-binding MarR family transcriptional regulator